jgi:RHS repeat-associated protein
MTIAAAALAIGATVASGLAGIPVFDTPASAEDLPFDGVVDVPEVGQFGDPIDVAEVPALPSHGSDEPVLDVPEGDFTNPPLPPHALPEEVAAYEEAHGFDPDESELIDGMTTATREVYQNADGSQTAIVSAAPVRYRDEDGEWADIELDYTEQADGDVVADETRVPVELPAEDPASVEVTTTGGEFAISAPDVVGDGPAPVDVDGSTAVVEGEDGIAAQIDMTASGFEQSVIVPDASSPSSYSVDVQLPDGVAARQTTGGVEFVNGNGQVVSRFGDGVAFDSANTGWNGAETGVEVTLAATAAGSATIDVAVSPAWFADPARVFPVTIDPVWVGYVTATGALDTWVKTGDTTPHAGHPELRIGTVDSGATTTRSLVRIPLPAHDSTTVVADAYLSLYTSSSQSCTNTGVVVAGLSAPFDSNTVWSNQPGTVGSPAPTTTQTNKGGGASCPAARVAYDVTALAQVWMSGTTQNANFRVRANNENANSDRKIFASGEGDPAQVPRLHLTYNTPPPAPTQSDPANKSTVMTTTPTLTANPVTDVDGGDIDYWFSLWTDDTPQWGGQVMSSGWVEDPSWTVPAGTLQDGGHYYRAVYVRDEDGATNQSGVRSFDVDLRLGLDQPSAYESAGPVSVNLATGNATVGIEGPSFPSVAGEMGASFTYNSQAPELTGLSGKYYNDDNHNGLFDEDPSLERTDPMIGFRWGTHSPGGGIGDDDFLVKWNGTITVPQGEGATNYFGGVHDNGMRVKIDGDLVYDNWSGSAWVAQYGGAYNLSVGTHTIEVQYRDTGGDAFISLYRKRAGVELPVPGSWLRPKNPPQGALPQGWTLSTPLNGAGPVQVVEANDIVTFRTADGGTCCAFVRSVNDGTWDPAPGQFGHLSEDDDGRKTLRTVDGTVYTFRPNGMLASATVPADSDNPAGWTPVYGLIDDLPRVMSITDPIGPSSGAGTRRISFVYRGSGDCPNGAGSGGLDEWTEVTVGLLCGIDYWDGQQTRIYYIDDRVARITNVGPDNESGMAMVTDFAYNNGNLTSVRSPLANDAIAAEAWDDSTIADTEIHYDGNGRVDRVRQPQPREASEDMTAEEADLETERPQAEFAYAADHTDVSYSTDQTGPSSTEQPNGYARRVSHDAAGRLIATTGAFGLTSSTTWDTDDRVTSTTNGAGMRTDTIYDEWDNATQVRGPAPASWFTSGPPSGSAIPTKTSTYDAPGGTPLYGLAATWWNNAHLASAPPVMHFGIGTDGEIVKDWGSGHPTGIDVSDNFSGRFTGWLRPAVEGDWDFRFLRDGKVRLFIDDEVVIDEWTESTAIAHGDPIHLTAEPHRIVVEYADTTGAASIALQWMTTSGWANIPKERLRPGYGNATSSTLPNGQTQTMSYNSPHLHQPTSSTTGAEGLSLTTSAAYEGGANDAFRRRTSSTNAAGNATSTVYYGRNATADDPCKTGSNPVNQGAQVKTITGPDPDGSGPADARVDEFVYDIAGRPVASRVNGSANWTCTTYDDRGRPTQVKYPTLGSAPQRVITYDYAVDGNPFVSSIDDTTNPGPSGIVTTVDLLGRTKSVTDVWDNVTRMDYDRRGRQWRSVGEGGELTTTFDSHGEPDVVRLDGDVLADVTARDAQWRITSVDYPSGTDKIGNGTSLENLHYDALGRADSITWNTAADTLLSSYSRSWDDQGRIVNDLYDGVDTRTGDNYDYDGLGRLTSAYVPVVNPTTHAVSTRNFSYAYAASSSCGSTPPTGFASNAGLNTNRTSMSIDGGTATTYCYDHADRLIKTTAGGIDDDITYDVHGNITQLGTATLGYDASDRHVSTVVDTDSRVTYGRDPSGTIVSREVPGETTLHYSGGPAGMGLTTNTSNQILQRTVSLPGGATVSLGTTETWSYSTLSGGVAATADGNGVKIGDTHHYDPYGGPLDGLPENREGSRDVGWGTSATEHIDGVPELIDLGARVYSPLLGRFLQRDPVRGGSANGYDYAAGDPINYSDPSGTLTNECNGCYPADPPPAMSGLDANPGGYRDFGHSVACQCSSSGPSNAAIEQQHWAEVVAYYTHYAWAAAVSYANALRTQMLQRVADIMLMVSKTVNTIYNFTHPLTKAVSWGWLDTVACVATAGLINPNDYESNAGSAIIGAGSGVMGMGTYTTAAALGAETAVGGGVIWGSGAALSAGGVAAATGVGLVVVGAGIAAYGMYRVWDGCN